MSRYRAALALALEAAREQHYANGELDGVVVEVAVAAYLDAIDHDDVSTALFGGPSRGDEVAAVLREIRP